jgi:hypothetical protein
MRALATIALVLLWLAPAAARGDDGRAAPRRAPDADELEAALPDADDDAELAVPGVEPERHDPRGRLASAPKIGAVLAAAYAAAGLDRDPGRGWVRRTRLAGLIPWLTVRTTRDTSWQDAQSEVGHGTTLEVRATWRLDRLLFDGHELQVATIEAARRRERMRLSSHVIRAYFAWRRARLGERHASDGRTASAIAETTAELDALTDGWFSEELARPSGNPGVAPPRSDRP